MSALPFFADARARFYTVRKINILRKNHLSKREELKIRKKSLASLPGTIEKAERKQKDILISLSLFCLRGNTFF